MNTPLRVLLATDYSSEAVVAERYAAELVHRNHVLCVLHVYYPGLTGALAMFEPEDAGAQEQKKLEQHTRRLFDRLGMDHRNVQVECLVKEAVNIAGTIIEEAQKFEADFIIMGMHGSGKLREVLMGSHTWDVMKQTNIPVLAIPAGASFEEISRIVYLTAYRDAEIPAIQFTSTLAHQFHADLILLHISAGETEIPPSFITQLSRHVPYPGLHLKSIREPHFMDALNHYCRKTGANWLVVSPDNLPMWEKHFDPGSPENTDMRKIRFLQHTPLLLIPDYGYLA